MLLLAIIGSVIVKENVDNYPYEMSKTFYFISFVYFLLNFNKILLYIENWQRNDNLLKEFLTNDDDFVKFSCLALLCFMGQFLRKVKDEWVRKILIGNWILLMIGMMAVFGSGRIYFVNHLMTYSVWILFLLIVWK